jgi:hypothetical protein
MAALQGSKGMQRIRILFNAEKATDIKNKEVKKDVQMRV